jgi:hypothetical protein
MKATTAAPSARPSAKISTEELASLLRIAPQTARAGLCRNSHYLGLKPVRLPNGRLLWDTAEVERLLAGEGAK